MSKQKFDKKNRKFIQSFKDAFRGIWLCVKEERNMRIHLIMAIYVLFFSCFIGLNRGEFALLFAVIGIVMSLEAVNTAVEKMCDFSCMEIDKRIAFIKDVAAASVLISAIFAVCTGFTLLYRPTEITALFCLITSNIYYVLAILMSIILSLIFVILGPVGIKKIFKKR